ncbi:2070_t:CDS:1, partial [Scutellospora calospora]
MIQHNQRIEAGPSNTNLINEVTYTNQNDDNDDLFASEYITRRI